jgi:hypothetical protein
MLHDLAAELAGYRDELAHARAHRKAGRAAAIEAEMARVRALIAAQAGVLDADADRLPDGPATAARARAAALRGAAGLEDAGEHEPRETAVPTRRPNKAKES